MAEKVNKGEDTKGGGLFPFMVDLFLQDGTVLKAELGRFTHEFLELGIKGSMDIGEVVRAKLYYRCDDCTEIHELFSGKVILTRPPEANSTNHTVRVELDRPINPHSHPILYTYLENPTSTES